MSAFIPNRRDPEVTARGVREGRRRQEARGRRRLRRHLGGAPRPHPAARAEFDAVLGDRPNQLDRQRDDVEVTAADLLDVHIGRPGHRGRACTANVSVGDPLPRGVAARARRRGDRQPHGGCRDRRDLALAGVAVDPPGPRHRGRHADHPRLRRGSHRRGARRGRPPRRTTGSTTPPRSSARSRSARSSRRSSRCRRTRGSSSTRSSRRTVAPRPGIPSETRGLHPGSRP